MNVQQATQELAEVYGVRCCVDGLEPGLGVSRAGGIRIAETLRSSGVACAAYRLAGGVDPSIEVPPTLVGSVEGWRLVRPGEGDPWPTESVLAVGEPPVGTVYRVLRSNEVDDAVAQVWLFYASPGDNAELAEQQILPELGRILDEAAAAGEQAVFVDSVGLIRRSQAAGPSDELAFDRAMERLRRGVIGVGAQHGYTADDGSPLWHAVYRYLGSRGGQLRWVTEDLSWRLQQQIVRHDHRRLSARAMEHFHAGQIDEAAEVMSKQIVAFHELNCCERNRRLACQIGGIVEQAEGTSRIIVVREIGHVNCLEEMLPGELGVATRIVATEPLGVLFARSGMETAVENFGVAPSAEALRLRALRQCIKRALPPSALRGLSLSQGARRLASTRIDALSEENVAEIVKRLHAPSRVFLRNAPYDHPIGEQLRYLLVDLEIIPPEMLRDPAERLLQRMGVTNQGRS